MINKVFLFFKKCFFIEIERYQNCLYCNKKLTGSKRKFCCISCSNAYHRSNTKVKQKPINIEKRLYDLKKQKANVLAYKKYPSLKGIVCEVCKKEKAVHRHHPDYNKPLLVKLVCWKCHGKIHAQLNVPSARQGR